MVVFRSAFLVVCTLWLVGCASYDASAPVRDINVHYARGAVYHQVQPGETLYAVAWRYDRDYRELAKLNHLNSPYAIYPGEKIILSGGSSNRNYSNHFVTKSKSKKRHAFYRSGPSKHPLKQHHVQKHSFNNGHVVHHWIWPIRGRVVHRFSFSRKGIDIAGNYGKTVVSAAAGKVVYSGTGIRGYGHLLIIKHNSEFLSAYAYNRALLVREGVWVKAGQRVAEIGMNSAGHSMLHFEIRRAGKPVNPLKYLSRNMKAKDL